MKKQYARRASLEKIGFEIRISASETDENSVLESGIHEERVYLYESLDKNLFMQGFLYNLYLRPSCYSCPSKGLKSGSDITLGDYWGIDSMMPKLDDDRVVSAVTVNTEKGRITLDSTTAVLWSTSWLHLYSKNPALVHSVIPDKRAAFFGNNSNTFHEKIKTLCRPTLKVRTLQILCLLLGKRGKIMVKRLLGK